MTLNTAQERAAEEARLAIACYGRGDVAGWELHRANAKRIRDAFEEWERSGDYWAERFAAPVRAPGGYLRQCRTCGHDVGLTRLQSHVRDCDAEQDRIRALQGAEIQQLRIRGLL